jgi:hypothetical protein
MIHIVHLNMMASWTKDDILPVSCQTFRISFAYERGGAIELETKCQGEKVFTEQLFRCQSS